MRTKRILTLTLFGLAGLPYAADDNAAAKPQAGSATTKEQSAAHAATDGAAAMENRPAPQQQKSLQPSIQRRRVTPLLDRLRGRVARVTCAIGRP
jgi:hypothetical protein